MAAGITRSTTIIGHVGGGGKVHSFTGGAEQQETQLDDSLLLGRWDGVVERAQSWSQLALNPDAATPQPCDIDLWTIFSH